MGYGPPNTSGGGITVGTTTSNGTANTLLKTDGSGKANDAPGLTNPSTGLLLATTGAQYNTVLFGTSGTPTTGLGSNGTNIALVVNGNGILGIGAAVSNNVAISSASQLQWSASGQSLDAVGDVGLKRVAATVLAVTDAGATNLGLLQTDGNKRVANNATNATATMANLADLTINVKAGRKYSGSFTYIAKNSTAAEGLAFDFAGGGATWTSVQFIFKFTPIGATIGVASSTAIGTALTATLATTTDDVYEIFFTGVCNAAGTLIPRFSEVSHTAGTAQVNAGSCSAINDNP